MCEWLHRPGGQELHRPGGQELLRPGGLELPGSEVQELPRLEGQEHSRLRGDELPSLGGHELPRPGGRSLSRQSTLRVGEEEERDTSASLPHLPAWQSEPYHSLQEAGLAQHLAYRSPGLSLQRPGRRRAPPAVPPKPRRRASTPARQGSDSGLSSSTCPPSTSPQSSLSSLEDELASLPSPARRTAALLELLADMPEFRVLAESGGEVGVEEDWRENCGQLERLADRLAGRASLQEREKFSTHVEEVSGSVPAVASLPQVSKITALLLSLADRLVTARQQPWRDSSKVSRRTGGQGDRRSGGQEARRTGCLACLEPG